MDWNLFAGLASYVCAACAVTLAAALMYFDENGTIQ